MVTTAAPMTMGMTVTMSATRKNDRVIGIAEQRVRRGARHRRGGKCRHCGECAGSKADQQQTLHWISPGKDRFLSRGI
jgi:hypothetical protein